MNAFKLDLMTLLALFVVLAVVVTMALGSNENDVNNNGSYNLQKDSTGSVTSVVPNSNLSFSYRTSQAVVPSTQIVSQSWR